MSRPRAVLAVPVAPAESGNGLAMRAGLLLEGLSRHWSVDVVVASVFGPPAGPGRLVARLAASCRVLELPANGDPRADMMLRLADRKQRQRAASLHPRPALCGAITLAAARELAALAAGADLVLVARLYLAPLIDVLLETAERPALLLDVDDLESDTHRALGEPEQAERFTRLEDHYLPLVDAVLTCSPADAGELAVRHGLSNAAVVPNAVRLPEVNAGSRRFDLLFVGNLGYRPNVDAALWLCHEVLPRLGDVRVAIVGSRPAAEVAELGSDERVTVAADVAVLSPWYAGAAIAVVPVRAGGGTRIKLLEALAHRRPVVATERGIAGLEWARGEAVLVANDPDAFAAACLRLLGDAALADQMARAGRTLVERHATVNGVAVDIERLALDIVSSVRAASR